MIAKKYKVERNEIDFILKKGELFYSRLFIVRSKKNDKPFPRFCVIISRKVDKSAVNRNRIKRKIFEILRHLIKTNKSSAKDFVLIPKKSIMEKDYSEIEKDMKELLANQNNG